MSDYTELIARAERAATGADAGDWTVDPDAYHLSPDDDMDNDVYWDVDGANGGWVAHVQDLPSAEFIAGSGRLVAELVSALREAQAVNERLRGQLSRIKEFVFDEYLESVLRWDDGEVIPGCIENVRRIVSETMP